MMTAPDYVAKLTHEERHEIIRTYKILEETGAVGDEAVRIHAKAFLEENDIPTSHIVLWMETITNACYRYYYEQMFDLGRVP